RPRTGDMENRDDRIVTLDDALRAVAGEDRTRRASPNVEAALLAELRRHSRTRRTRASTAVAAVLAAAIPVPLWLGVTPPAGRSTATTARTEPRASAPQEVTTDFLPLAYSGVPLSNGTLVRMRVPRGALVSFGLAPIDFAPLPGTVLADVLVGEDGLAR